MRIKQEGNIFYQVLNSRLSFPMTVSLIPLAALGLYDLSERLRKFFNFKYMKAVLLVLFSLYPLYFSLLLVFNPTHAPLESTDRDQYISAWPAGWGVREANAYLADVSKDQKVTVFTQGTFGLMPYSLELYQQHNPNLKIVGLWPIDSEMPSQISDSAKENPTYVLFYQPCPSCTNTFDPPPTWPTEKVMQSNLGHLAIYKINSQ